MTDDWVVIAALILAAMSNEQPIPWGDGWLWPIPEIQPSADPVGPGIAMLPVVSQEFRGAGGGRAPHYGVDLMYRNPDPPPVFTAPAGVPVLAARAGKLWSVTRTARGWAIVLDHGPPFATFYQHLESVDPVIAHAQRGELVQAGKVLGVMGSDPTDGGHVRHLHFAVWYRGFGDNSSVDPAKAMESWRRVSWTPQAIA